MKKMDFRQLAVWTAALVLGAALGSAYTRLFQFVAVSTITLAVATTLASLGAKKSTGRLFLHTITYTLLTTLAAALVGLGLYVLVAPGNLPADVIAQSAAATDAYQPETLYGHILNVIPNNAVRPFFEGNVLSILFVAAAVGLGLAAMPASEGKSVVEKGLFGLQELLFTLIKGLVKVLPLGIVAFSAQLAAQVKAGMVVGSCSSSSCCRSSSSCAASTRCASSRRCRPRC